MAQKTIAIIGATGRMGSAITKALAKNNGNELLLMARDQQKIKKLSDFLKEDYPSTSILTVQCSKNACWEADIIILAIPAGEEAGVANYIKEVVTQKIVISISPETSLSQLQQVIPYSKIVKAFYANTPQEIKNAIPGKEINSMIMSDDEEALNSVSNLLRSIGLKPGEVLVKADEESGQRNGAQSLHNLH